MLRLSPDLFVRWFASLCCVLGMTWEPSTLLAPIPVAKNR